MRYFEHVLTEGNPRADLGHTGEIISQLGCEMPWHLPWELEKVARKMSRRLCLDCCNGWMDGSIMVRATAITNDDLVLTIESFYLPVG